MFGFFIKTYGCKVNQYESQSVREYWNSLEGGETDKPEDADIILISSCAVTREAVSDARQFAGKLSKINPHSVIIVSGCAASVSPGDFTENNVLVIPQRKKSVLLSRNPLNLTEKDIEEWEVIKKYPPFTIQDYRRARPVLKVQDGCSQCCTYCVIPLTRGYSVSRDVSEILSEIQCLLDKGFGEIILSGINLNQYHADKNDGKNFWSLVRAIEEHFKKEYLGKVRFRISSLDPIQVTSMEGLETLEASTLLCPHLHLSLQHGSDAVLSRMNRSTYSIENILSAVERIRKFWNVMALGADLITGFPGETEEEFQDSVTLVKELPLTYAHIFPYSPRPGTRAELFPDQISVAIKRERSAILREIVKEKHRLFLEQQLSLQKMKVIFDNVGESNGHNDWYAECRLEKDNGFKLIPHSLVDVSPLRIDQEKIIVRYTGEN